MADYTGSNGNDILFFDGQMMHLSETFTNAYGGTTLTVDDDYNVNTSTYEGLAGIDTLYMTNIGDALFLTNDVGVQVIRNIEQIIAGEGGDLILLDNPAITLGDMLIDGGAGDDILWANAGNDTVRGLGGNDNIDGGPGNDNVQGLDDDDTVNGGAGNDWVRGDNGNDTLIYFADAVWDAGYATINAVTGETVDIDGLNRSYDTFDGGAGADVLQMTDGDDALILDDPASPRHGSTSGARVTNIETINAGAGDDVVNLTSATYAYGNVTVNGGAGNDTLWAGAGNDTVNGDAGDDHINGGAGDDTLNGGEGNDDLSGGDGNDILSGGAGIDHLAGGAGNDILHFGAGDSYDGGAGADTLQMTAGADVFVYDGANLAGVETINAAGGDDHIDLHGAAYGDVTVDGGGGNDFVQASGGNDTVLGGDGDDTLAGQEGDDVLAGGAGDDILYGGDMTGPSYTPHSFSDDAVFPDLTEQHNLDPGEEQALGVAAGDLSVDYNTTGTVTFVESGAGYKNTLGVYNIAADGTIQSVEIAFAQVKAAYAGQTFEVNLPGAPDSDFGFFIIADGYSVNGGYAGLDLDSGNLQFLYKAGTADERLAKITDSAADISLVYDDGATHTALQGPVYHTTERDGSLSLNPDGQEHVVSGLVGGETATHSFDAVHQDFNSHPDSLSSHGITISTDGGYLTHKGGNSGNDKIGIKEDFGSSKVNGDEVMEIRFDHHADTVKMVLDDVSGKLLWNIIDWIFGTHTEYGIDLKVYVNGDMGNPVSLEVSTAMVHPVNGQMTITLDASDFGSGAYISGVDVYSDRDSGLKTDDFWIHEITTTEAPAAAPDDVLRIGFEDLPCLGDADYNDVVFDLTIDAPVAAPQQAGDDVLIGGAGNDVLYGGGGADEFVFTEKDGSVDTIKDFSFADGDKLNITDILEDYNPLDDAIGDFVRLTQQGDDTILEVNYDGADNDFAAVAIIEGGTQGATLADLINNGQLVTDHSVTV